jgi:ornithine cyclodeaminase/alanine dehydrogenase-like protein (mu-crystallin family)
MTNPALQLDTEDLLSVLDVINPIDVLIEELISKAAGRPERPPNPDGRLAPWRRGASAEGGSAAEMLLLEDLRIGGRCVLPRSALYVVRTASLTALAARELAVPGVVTAAVLGFDLTAQTSLSLIARYLPGLSHVAVCPIGDEPNQACGPMEPRIIDQLDLTGVGWSVTAGAAEAVFGATLIVATVASARWLEVGHLAKGAVLINATGEELSGYMVDAVDQIYVDDAALIGSNSNAAALDRTGTRCPSRIEADVAQVLTGAHAGRMNLDHILLVELLGVRELDVQLACALHRAALEHDLGVWLLE